jgi:hypothetical protein
MISVWCGSAAIAVSSSALASTMSCRGAGNMLA